MLLKQKKLSSQKLKCPLTGKTRRNKQRRVRTFETGNWWNTDNLTAVFMSDSSSDCQGIVWSRRCYEKFLRPDVGPLYFLFSQPALWKLKYTLFITTRDEEKQKSHTAERLETGNVCIIAWKMTKPVAEYLFLLQLKKTVLIYFTGSNHIWRTHCIRMDIVTQKRDIR